MNILNTEVEIIIPFQTVKFISSPFYIFQDSSCFKNKHFLILKRKVCTKSFVFTASSGIFFYFEFSF